MEVRAAVAVAEARRVAALQEYELLDRPAPAELEALVRVAAAARRRPHGDVEPHRRRPGSASSRPSASPVRTPRGRTRCAPGTSSPGSFVHIPDARRSPEYLDNPWVDGRLANVRFYASLPLLNPDGFALGTLCLFDDVERSLRPEQIARLEDLGVALVGLFERRRQARRNAELAVEAETQRAHWSLAARELEARTELTRAVLETRRGRDRRGRPRRAPQHVQPRGDRVARPARRRDARPRASRRSTTTCSRPTGRTPLAPRPGAAPACAAGRRGGGGRARHRPRRAATLGASLCSGRSIARADGTPLGAVVAMSDVTSDRLPAGRARGCAHPALDPRGRTRTLQRRARRVRRRRRPRPPLAAGGDRRLSGPVARRLRRVDGRPRPGLGRHRPDGGEPDARRSPRPC